MKIPPVKINTVTPKVSQNTLLKQPTPIKDALVVSGFCAIPIAFYEAVNLVSKKLKSDTFEYQ